MLEVRTTISKTSTITACCLYLLLSAAQAQPLIRKQDAGHSDGPPASDAYLPTDSPSDPNSDDYTEPPGPSHSMFPHFNILVQIAIIGGAFMVSVFSIILLIFAYLRHKTKVEIKAERRRTALRMSIMAQQRADLDRRRKSQMIIMEQLEKLRDDPECRPTLPSRASLMPGYNRGGVGVQAGVRSGRGDGVFVVDDKWGLAPMIGIKEIKLMDDDSDDEVERDNMLQTRPQRKIGFV